MIKCISRVVGQDTRASRVIHAFDQLVMFGITNCRLNHPISGVARYRKLYTCAHTHTNVSHTPTTVIPKIKACGCLFDDQYFHALNSFFFFFVLREPHLIWFLPIVIFTACETARAVISKRNRKIRKNARVDCFLKRSVLYGNIGFFFPCFLSHVVK